MTGTKRTTTLPTTWRVRVGEETTSAILEAPADVDEELAGSVLVLGHGAGGRMDDASQSALAAALVARGLAVVRFNFLYAEQGRRAPDRMPRVTACFAAVVDHVRAALSPRRVLLGGRSMGGRAASMMAAEGFACDGLLLYAYPLHPAGQPEKLRDAHLPSIRVPVWSASGTRDDLCTQALMDAAVARARAAGVAWEHAWLEGADHSFHVRGGRAKDAQVLADVADGTARFVRTMCAAR